jgi:hypothetical protein
MVLPVRQRRGDRDDRAGLLAAELTEKTVPLKDSLGGRAILTGKPFLGALILRRLAARPRTTTASPPTCTTSFR